MAGIRLKHGAPVLIQVEGEDELWACQVRRHLDPPRGPEVDVLLGEYAASILMSRPTAVAARTGPGTLEVQIGSTGYELEPLAAD
jgi:hypothetical protein